MSRLIQLKAATAKRGQQSFGAFNVSVGYGERVAILGPSGAGKSTLLKLMSREINCHSGNVVFASRPLRHWSLPELSTRRAVLPQASEVAFGLKVELVVALGRVARTHDPELAAVVRAALQLAHGAHLLGRRFDTLCGGEQARVQLARVFAQLWDVEKGLILVDEPLAALDPGLQFDLLDNIQHFAQQRCHAVIAVLHDINHALLVFDRLLLVKAGQLIADLLSGSHVLPYLEALYGIKLSCVANDRGNVLVMPMRRQLSKGESEG